MVSIVGRLAVIVFVVVVTASSCADGGSGNNDNQNANQVDAQVEDWVRLRGVVWSPGADLLGTLEENRFPIPGAAVMAYPQPPGEPQPQTNCDCVKVPAGTPTTKADPVDGSFELVLMPGRTYWLTVQKGDFRRVREIQVPDTPGEVWEPGSETGYGQPRPAETTLPARTARAMGDSIPRIAVLHGIYEDLGVMFSALGMHYPDRESADPAVRDGTDIDVFDGDHVAALLQDASELARYSLVIVPCGAEWPGGDLAADNLRSWVKGGGKLYVDDFSYDFVEQVWPEFLSWYVADDSQGGAAKPCGTGDTAPGETGACNNWASYDFIGDPGDATDFAAWIALPEVNGGFPIQLLAAWDYLYELGAGEVAIDPEHGTGPNGEVYLSPRVWMYNSTPVPFGDPPVPATVSWPYYCGRVLYTVYHTHSGGGGDNYLLLLLLQEKIMMYLILEIQTCIDSPIVL